MLSNKEIGERIKARREALDLTLDDVAAVIGVHKSTIQRYEGGRIKRIKLPVIESIAGALSANPDWLVGNVDDPTVVSRPLHAKNIIPMPEMSQVPLLGAIACGTPITAEENVEDIVPAPADFKADFALRCQGDSMTGAEIYDGDIVYIHQTEDFHDGQICAVVIEDEATLKRVYWDEERQVLQLIAENPNVRPMVYTGEILNHVRVVGVAVGLTRRLA